MFSLVYSNHVGSSLTWLEQLAAINGPLLVFEIYQQGFGMYVKYLMVGFLVVFAVSMLVQFMGYFLRNSAELIGENVTPD